MNRDMDHEEDHLYFLALCLVAAADDLIPDVEERQLRQIGNHLGMKDSEYDKLLNKAKDDPACVRELRKINDPVTARTIYRDCLLMTIADHYIHPKEKLMLESIRMNLGISETLADRFDEWMVEGLDWQMKGERLVNEGEER